MRFQPWLRFLFDSAFPVRYCPLRYFFPHLSTMAKSPEETASGDQQSSKPIETFRHFGISASVFENQGQKGPYFSVAVQKRFKPEDGDWKNTTNFRRDELPVLQELVRQAYAFILEKESQGSGESAAT